MSEITPETIKEWPTEDIEKHRDRLEIELADLKADLEDAHTAFIETGKKTDPGWLADTRQEKREVAREHQVILREMGRRRSAIAPVGRGLFCFHCLQNKADVQLATTIANGNATCYEHLGINQEDI